MVTHIDSVDGVPWYRAPMPPRWHRCRPWTVGTVDEVTVQRCACGSARYGKRGRWFDRNSRRKVAAWWR